MMFRSTVKEMHMSLDHISLALHAAEVQAEVLDSAEREVLMVRVQERLGVDVTVHAPWDNSFAPDGKIRPDGWELIPMYVGATSCLMFLDCAKVVWKFKSGSDLLRVLKESPALEFYVCDEKASYLLCSNHHDFVIGWGAAQLWVDELGGG
jgi:hypothetical protein